jgi:hypothetical protein
VEPLFHVAGHADQRQDELIVGETVRSDALASVANSLDCDCLYQAKDTIGDAVGQIEHLSADGSGSQV